MRVTAWIAPGTWPAVVDALLDHHDGDEITLIAAADGTEVMPPGMNRALMGRGRHWSTDDSWRMAEVGAEDLLRKASLRLGTEAATRVVVGHAEQAIPRAADEAEWLVMARDGDRSRLGPRSLGRAARFIIDHAPCTVELIWPEQTPRLDTIPAPPAPLP
ncbi:universal stress protein [Propionibacterium sp.]|uniref:universal stress protein n=1 Tax=Propionibacterium sp. TaxID=1977903 RepID=UPI0039EC108F